MRLKDRVVIVTGSAQGIGKAYAKRCAEEGAKVALADVKDAQPVAEEIRAMGGEALAVHTDVSNAQDTQAMAEKTIAQFGRIDVLVNNAGLTLIKNTTNFWEIPLDDWDTVFAVSVKGSLLCAKAVFPYMREQGKGKIINIASGVVFNGSPGMLSHVSSKGAVVAMTRGMARELGKFNIAVNTIAPGFTLSEGMMNKPEQIASKNERLKSLRCFQRDMFAEDLTGTMLYFASDDSDFTTGQVVNVDGGMIMH